MQLARAMALLDYEPSPPPHNIGSRPAVDDDEEGEGDVTHHPETVASSGDGGGAGGGEGATAAAATAAAPAPATTTEGALADTLSCTTGLLPRRKAAALGRAWAVFFARRLRSWRLGAAVRCRIKLACARTDGTEEQKAEAGAAFQVALDVAQRGTATPPAAVPL